MQDQLSTDTTTTTTAAAATNNVTNVNIQSAVNSAVAGYAAGMTGVIIGHPLDSLKVWIQTKSVGQNKFLQPSNTEPHHATTTTTTTTSTSATSSSSSSMSSTVSKMHSTKGVVVPPLQHAPPQNATLGATASMSTIASTSSSFSASTAAAKTTTTTTTTAALSNPKSLPSKPLHLSLIPTTHLRTLRALYSGVSTPLLTVGIVQSITFSTYDASRRVLYHYQQQQQQQQSQKQQQTSSHHDSMEYLHHDSLGNVAMAGFVAGAILSFLTSPLQWIKTRQQITGTGFRQVLQQTTLTSSSSSSSSWWTGGKQLILASMSGIYPHFLSESFGRALYYAVYEGTKREMIQYKTNTNSQQQIYLQAGGSLSIGERMVAAAISGMACWALIFPLDSVRNRLYSQQQQIQQQHQLTQSSTLNTSKAFGPSSSLSSSSSILSKTLETTRIMYHEGSLYRGFGVTILRAGPVAACVLPVYDCVLEYMSNDIS